MLDAKIKRNLTEQIIINRKIDEARRTLNELEYSKATNSGALQILSELYQEETGKDLQKTINTDPEWQKWIKEVVSILPQAADEETAKPVVKPQPAQQPQPAAEPSAKKLPEMPKLRSVTENKKLEEPPKVERTRQPVQVVITDGGTTPIQNDGDDDDDDDTER